MFFPLILPLLLQYCTFPASYFRCSSLLPLIRGAAATCKLAAAVSLAATLARRH